MRATRLQNQKTRLSHIVGTVFQSLICHQKRTRWMTCPWRTHYSPSVAPAPRFLPKSLWTILRRGRNTITRCLYVLNLSDRHSTNTVMLRYENRSRGRERHRFPGQRPLLSHHLQTPHLAATDPFHYPQKHRPRLVFTFPCLVRELPLQLSLHSQAS